MNGFREAFDVDGVVVAPMGSGALYRAFRRLSSQRITGRVFEWLLHTMQDRARLLFLPPLGALLITARPVSRKWATLLSLKRLGVFNEVEFRANEYLVQEQHDGWLESVAAYKAEVLERYEISVYYDDDARLCEELKRRVPSCQIVCVAR